MPGLDSLQHSAQCLHSSPLQAQNLKLWKTAPRTARSVQNSRPSKQWGCSSRHSCRAGLLQVISCELLVLCMHLTAVTATGTAKASADLWTPDQSLHFPDVQAAAAPAVVSPGSGYEDHKPRTPPPDLPSLLLDSRITYLGMPVNVACSVGVTFVKHRPYADWMRRFAVGSSSDRADHSRIALSAIQRQDQANFLVYQFYWDIKS